LHFVQFYFRGESEIYGNAISDASAQTVTGTLFKR